MSIDCADALMSMLDKQPARRCSITKLREHAFLTRDGQRPLPSIERNCGAQFKVTPEDVRVALSPTYSTVMVQVCLYVSLIRV